MREKMHNNAANLLATWSADITGCFEQPNPDGALEQLGVALKHLVPYDFSTCLVLRRDAAPLSLLAELPREYEPIPYEQTPYMLDPLYQHLEAGTLPTCCSLRDIMPDDFEKSEFFRYYYDHPDDFDEYSFNIPLADGAVCHFAMTRTGQTCRFSAEEQALFVAVEPLVARVLQQAAQTQQHQHAQPEAEAGSFHAHLRGVLDKFGTSLLTEREQQVLRMCLRGYSDVVSAEKLAIQPSTLRNHKKSIFRKLGVTSQGQVFGLLISALKLPAARVAEIDPLTVLNEL